MLLRHTVTALALAATLGLGAAPAGMPAASGAGPLTPAQGQLDEVGGGPGLVCLGCVAAGVVTLASSGWAGVLFTFLVGGPAAVSGGAAVAACTAACIQYFSQD